MYINYKYIYCQKYYKLSVCVSLTLSVTLNKWSIPGLGRLLPGPSIPGPGPITWSKWSISEMMSTEIVIQEKGPLLPGARGIDQNQVYYYLEQGQDQDKVQCYLEQGPDQNQVHKEHGQTQHYPASKIQWMIYSIIILSFFYNFYIIYIILYT